MLSAAGLKRTWPTFLRGSEYNKTTPRACEQGQRGFAPRVARQSADRRHAGDLLGICVKAKVLGHLPDEDLAIVGRRGDDAIIERVPTLGSTALSCISGERSGRARDAPVGVQHGGSVASEQRYLVGELAALVHGNDSECATTARLPIDRDVLGVDLRSANVSFTPPQCRSVGQVGSRGRHGTFSKLVSQALRLIWRLS